MADYRASKPRPPRAPLGDATSRVNSNNGPPAKALKPVQVNIPPPNPLRAHPPDNQRPQKRTSSTKSAPTRPMNAPVHMNSNVRTNTNTNTNSHTSAVPKAVQRVVKEDTRRASQISTVSTFSNGRRRKTQVGPWELGKTLGNGSAAHVRLVRHNVTGELAAVKILARDGNTHTQPGSIAALDKWDRSREEYKAENRIPLAIEREVAIMKLIDHPNIVKLYDIWENRAEIYLVLEYVPRGDLYSYLGQAGRLSEMETMFYFRQILSAVQFIHSLDICHRDLKPENILIAEDGQLKITDFGMSALHQSRNHMLKTSCGSPHYAAPELIGDGAYRGETIDLWSLGVILYACLVNVLPFNDDSVTRLLNKIQKGIYHVPAFLTPESRDLVTRILEVNPEKRITPPEIWEHPLVRRFDHLDNLNNPDNARDYRLNARNDPVPPEEVDTQTLRQLKAVWHTYSEAQLAAKLISPEKNNFKVFYWLLHTYREKQMENYNTDLTYSASDYHHLKPQNWKQTCLTREFTSKDGRSASRFTVISTIATDKNGDDLESTDGAATVMSYDPYKASRVIEDVVASQARIVVHRNGTTSTRASRAASGRSGSVRTNSTYSRHGRGGRYLRPPPTSLRNSRHSLNSIRSGEEISCKRPVIRRKRGVNFSHIRKQSTDQNDMMEHKPASIAGDDTTINRDHTTPASPAQKRKLSRNSGRRRSGTRSLTNVSQAEGDGLHWNDELRQFSYSIAKDCDDAFNSTLLSQGSYISDSAFESPTSESGMSSSFINTAPIAQGTINARARDSREHRPVPPPKDVDTTPTTKRVDKATLQLHRRTHIIGAPDRADADRRVVSAPIYSQYSTQWGKDKIPLPSINEAIKEDEYYGDGDKPRVVSAPAESSMLANEGEELEFLAQKRNTIRMVDASLSRAPASASATPSARSKPQQNLSLYPQIRQDQSINKQYANKMRDPVSGETTMVSEKESAHTIKKKASWFKRGSKDKSSFDGPMPGDAVETNRKESKSSAGPATIPLVKKKSFGLAFWRKEQPKKRLSVADADSDWDDASSADQSRIFSNPFRPASTKGADESTKRKIDPQLGWFARIFGVKPATRYICFAIPRNRVRHELVILLRDWRRHGMRDLEVDRDRNLVFARVAKKNHLNLKEASFAAEIMTVIEHGSRNELCIVRFTQERGAATTFHKVVDALNDVFKWRGLLVVDKNKTKKMVQTLDGGIRIF